MIRLVYCFVRREDISKDDFRRYWRSAEHREKVQSLADLFSPDFVIENLSLELPDIENPLKKTMARGTHYDAMIEFYWKNPTVVAERLADTAVTKIMKILAEHSSKIMDGDKSTVFFTEVNELPVEAMLREAPVAAVS